MIIWLNDDKEYSYDEGNKNDLQSNYQLYLDGQHALETSSAVRIADFIGLKQCVTLVEI